MSNKAKSMKKQKPANCAHSLGLQAKTKHKLQRLKLYIRYKSNSQKRDAQFHAPSLIITVTIAIEVTVTFKKRPE